LRRLIRISVGEDLVGYELGGWVGEEGVERQAAGRNEFQEESTDLVAASGLADDFSALCIRYGGPDIDVEKERLGGLDREDVRAARVAGLVTGPVMDDRWCSCSGRHRAERGE
jgi:hypothetical protein